MENFFNGLTDLANLLVWSYMAIFIILSYGVKDILNNLISRIHGVKWLKVYTVLIIAALVAIPYILLTSNPWENILLSYAVGTSFHELIFARIEKMIKG